MKTFFKRIGRLYIGVFLNKKQGKDAALCPVSTCYLVYG